MIHNFDISNYIQILKIHPLSEQEILCQAQKFGNFCKLQGYFVIGS
jgi:hypothetical protein